MSCCRRGELGWQLHCYLGGSCSTTDSLHSVFQDILSRQNRGELSIGSLRHIHCIILSRYIRDHAKESTEPLKLQIQKHQEVKLLRSTQKNFKKVKYFSENSLKTDKSLNISFFSYKSKLLSYNISGKDPFVPEPKLVRDIPIQYFISK